MNQKEHQIIISLASNENQKRNMEAAREQLSLLLNDLRFTTEHWTEPVHSLRKEPYLNQLCQGTTAFGVNLLNEVLKEIEKRLGRTHNEEGIVTIDLDLMSYDGLRYHLRDWDRDYIKNLISEL
ncbi:MAG: 2-amino-4-hydroxy-6-hydroxymethyldihydropteridine diphosphokinase [Prevotella sp.]|nr:2-amino-4-hydroxy-6-hydroxymethyldihydropteridine diphosphokinase [Prevotella sp.]